MKVPRYSLYLNVYHLNRLWQLFRKSTQMTIITIVEVMRAVAATSLNTYMYITITVQTVIGHFIC